MAVNRCPWAGPDPLMLEYHDREWGVPLKDVSRLFEFLVLEGAQAGLSWMTILRKRDAYRRALYNFDPARVASMGPRNVDRLLQNEGIVRNRRKLESAITNARVVRQVDREDGGFVAYAWSFVGGKPIRNAWRQLDEIPAQTDESRAMSKDLLRRGATFVGPTICYAFMQATGMVNDHLVTCFRYRELVRTRA